MRFVSSFALAAGVVTLSGCGGQSVQKPMSDSAFVTKANSICADVYKQFANADYDARSGVLSDGADRLNELVPPPAKQRTFNQFLTALKAEARTTKELFNGGTDLTDRFIEQEDTIVRTAKAMGAQKCTTVAGKQ